MPKLWWKCMEDLTEIVRAVMLSTIVLNLVSSFALSLALYIDAPERGEIGFNKYWQALMMDAAPWSGKKLLQYEDRPSRYKLFFIHRVMSSIGIVVVFLGVVAMVVLE